MESSYFDYKRSLEILRKLNNLISQDEYLKNLFIYKGFNLLQSTQANFFIDIKGWTKSKDSHFFARTSFLLILKNFVSIFFVSVISVVSIFWLLVFRKKLLIFTGDKVSSKNGNYDFRLDPLYGALNNSDMGYIELVHTISGKIMFLNFFKRLRPVIYLEAFDWTTTFKVNRDKKKIEKHLEHYNLSQFSPEEQVLVKFLIIKHISAVNIFKLRIPYLKSLLALSSVKRIFSIDDVRHYNEIVLVSKFLGIKFYAIQHGHFTKYHVGWLAMTDNLGEIIKPERIIVWSEYWKNQLLKLGTYFKQEDMLVGGTNDFVGEPYFPKILSKKISILIPYESDAPKVEVKAYISELLKEPNFEVIFKIRADLSEEEQLIQYGLLNLKDKISITKSVKDVLQRTDVALGSYSTFLYEMVVLLRPVGILETSIDYGMGMVEGSLAELVQLRGIKEKLLEIANTPKEILEDRREKLLGRGETKLSETLKKMIKDVIPN